MRDLLQIWDERCVQRFGCSRNSYDYHASTWWKKLTELLVLTDFGVCLPVELVCCLFIGVGRAVVKRSRGCDSYVLGGCVTLNLLQRAWYMRTFYIVFILMIFEGDTHASIDPSIKMLFIKNPRPSTTASYSQILFLMTKLSC